MTFLWRQVHNIHGSTQPDALRMHHYSKKSGVMNARCSQSLLSWDPFQLMCSIRLRRVAGLQPMEKERQFSWCDVHLSCVESSLEILLFCFDS